MCKARITANPSEMNSSEVKYRTLTLRERFLRKFLGSLHKITVIVPGENVHMEIVTEQGSEEGVYESV